MRLYRYVAVAVPLAVVVVLLCTHLQSVHGLPFPQGCGGDGGGGGGGEVAVPDPCVKCRCVRGSLVCRLRVCSPQPHPPPPGCLVLTRRAECCQRLVCSHSQEPAAAEINRRRLSDDFLDDSNSQNGCTVNGTVYAEGSAMDSSTRCEYCYCIRGEQRCVRPQCQLARTDCTPSYTAGSCCPAKYDCNAGLTTTTSKPTSECEVAGTVRLQELVPERKADCDYFSCLQGCKVAGRLYPDGELISGQGSDCESCYCLLGRVQCEPVVCTVPVNKQCAPVFTAGHCCPTSYNCSVGALDELAPINDNMQEDMLALNTLSIDVNQVYENSERSITGTKSTYDKTMITDTTQSISTLETTPSYEESTILDTTTLKEEATTIEDIDPNTNEASDVITEVPTTTEGETTTIFTTNSDLAFTDAEQRIISRGQEELTTSQSDEEITTMLSVDSGPSINTTNEYKRHNTTSAPNKSLSSEIEAILNNTKLANKDNDYDYDYNEPSLPPSLPNLRIIPFVAADAVVDDHQEPVYGQSLKKSHSSDDNQFYDISHPHGFSPPSETEGGFVPKESMLDGPFYESKHDSDYHTTGHKNGLPVDITSGTLSSLPDISGPPKATEEASEHCVRGGQSYRHGELLSAPLSCELCVCFYGKVLCQEPKCPIPDPGCQLLHDQLDHSTCCQKIVCSGNNVESPTRVVEHLTPAPHLPPFTVADVIVTPDPFRDVIRTEPAPDLSSLIGEILPFLWDQSTSSTTPVSLTTAEPNEAVTTNLSLEENSSVAEPFPTHSEIRTTLATHLESNVSMPFSMSPTYSAITTTTSSSVTTLPPNIVLNNQSETKLKPPDDYDNKETKEGDKVDDDDEFSLDSVFSYLFDSDKWTTTTEKNPKTKKPPYLIKVNSSHFTDGKFVNKTLSPKANISKVALDPILEHRSDEDINELSLSNSTIINQTTNPETTTRHMYDNKPSLLVTLQTSPTKSTPFTVKVSTSTVPHTTIKNLVYKQSTKRYGIKYSSTNSRPIMTKSTTAPQMSADPGAASGLLKLAGCNIYGRMYRVGRIISELSGPCLECMCTEVGVQCRPLKC